MRNSTRHLDFCNKKNSKKLRGKERWRGYLQIKRLKKTYQLITMGGFCLDPDPNK